MNDAELLAEIEDLIRLAPSYDASTCTPEAFAWIGRTSAVIKAWNRIEAVSLALAKSHYQSSHAMTSAQGYGEIMTILHEARHTLRMNTVGPLGIAVNTGGVFDYFDELRRIVESANSEIMFIDPYLDAEFVSRYLVHVRPTTVIRLLAREKLATLMPAVELFSQQHKNALALKSAGGFHDRYVVVDNATCFQSGASFKDGAKKTPTTLTQIVDAFSAVQKTYEDIWANGSLVFQR